MKSVILNGMDAGDAEIASAHDVLGVALRGKDWEVKPFTRRPGEWGLVSLLLLAVQSEKGRYTCTAAYSWDCGALWSRSQVRSGGDRYPGGDRTM